MKGRGRASVLAAVLTAAALAALLAVVLVGGDGDDEPSASVGGKTSSVFGRRASSRPGPGLARPVHPRCAFPRFDEPEVRRIEGPTAGGKAWQVAYLPRGSSTRPGETSNVMIVEESPRLRQFGMEGGQPVTVAGRRVSIRPPTPESRVYAAQWNTRRARYTALANGSTSTVLERFIACLP
jgi:hypothetical protein